MHVTLRITPHVIWWAALCLFGFPLLLFLSLGITEFFKTGEPGVLFSGSMPAIALYAIFRLIFHIQSSSDLFFWEQALQLEKLHP